LLTFTPAASAPVAATLSDAGDTSGQGDNDDGLFDGVYSFVVPATLTSGTLTIAAGAFSGTEFNFTNASTTVDITAPQTLAVSFPSLAKTATRSKPPWYGAPFPPTAAVGTKSLAPVTSTGSGGFPIWLAVVLLVLVAGGVVLIQRKRRGTPVTVPAGGAQTADAGVAGRTGETRATDTAGVAAVVVETPRTVPVPADSPTAVEAAATPPTDPMLKLFGPIGYDGYRQVSVRRVIEELLCWLVLHSQHVHNADEIQLALRPTDGSRSEPSRKTFHSYLSALRQCIGAEHLPDATNAGGYRIVGIECDWFTFQRLSAEADRSTGAKAIELRTQALALVRGMPFQGVPRGQYEWVFNEGLDTQMSGAVVTCALRLFNELMDLGRCQDAEDAAKAGLRGATEDLRLKQARDRATEARNEVLAHPGRSIGDELPADPDPDPDVDDGDGPANPGDPDEPT
jgi:hypothetical protein